MFNKKKRAACAAILLAASSVFCAYAQAKQDATEFTAEANNAIYELLDFSDEQEFVRGEKGWIVFDCTTGLETAEAGLALFREKYSRVPAVL